MWFCYTVERRQHTACCAVFSEFLPLDPFSHVVNKVPFLAAAQRSLRLRGRKNSKKKQSLYLSSCCSCKRISSTSPESKPSIGTCHISFTVCDRVKQAGANCTVSLPPSRKAMGVKWGRKRPDSYTVFESAEGKKA